MTLLAKDTGIVYSTAYHNWEASLPPLLDLAQLGPRVSDCPLILIKPNLVEALAPPITTPVSLISSLVSYLKKHTQKCRIIIGEGTGSLEYDTFHPFKTLGYLALAQRENIELMDLNKETLTHRKNSECKRWPEMYLPEILDEAFLLSVPVLKAHSLSQVTLTMKNMMGCAPPSHYQGNGAWGKSSFHTNIHEAVYDLNRYRTPDFTLLDATIGMAQAHLWGPHCNPPVNTLAASWDPVAIDSYGTSLLQCDWQEIKHIRLAHEILGQAAPLEIHTP